MASNTINASAAVRGSLTRAGIRSRYHARGLDTVPGADALKSWVVENAQAVIHTGIGCAVFGPTAAARDACILAARALHLQGCKVRVVPLVRLIRTLHERPNDEDVAEWIDCDALCVLDFYDGGECPYTRWQIKIAGEFLSERLDDRRAVCLWCPEEGLSKWWPTELVQRVAEQNTVFKVGKQR